MVLGKDQLTQLYSDLKSRHEAKQELIEYKAKANYWEAQIRQIKQREQELTNEIEELKAAADCLKCFYK